MMEPELLAVAREYYFGDYSSALAERLVELRKVYRARYPSRYSVHLDFRPLNLTHRRLGTMLKILFRRQRGYRLIDRLFTIRILGWIYPLLRRRSTRMVPSFANQQAMGLDSIFK